MTQSRHIDSIAKSTSRDKEIRAVAASPYFDAKWYETQLEGSGFTTRKEAAAHYCTIGWRKGICPSPSFDGNKYLENNSDVAAAGVCPLVHYIQYGRDEGRNVRGVVKDASHYPVYGWLYSLGRIVFRALNHRRIRRNRNARILVHLHMFYPDAWDAIKEYLQNLAPYSHSLHVSYVATEGMQETIQRISEFAPQAHIYEVDNKGFDIAPFADLINSLNLEDYDVIYHAHSKSVSPKKSGRLVYGRLFRGDNWFRQLFSGIWGVHNVHKGLDALLHDPRCGMIAAGNLLFQDLPPRTRRLKQYAARWDLQLPTDYTFVAGTCFGIRARHLRWIQQKKLSGDCFRSARTGSFTLAHAVERFLSTEVVNAGDQIKPMRTWVCQNAWGAKRMMKRQKRKAAKMAGLLANLGVEAPRQLLNDWHSGMNCSFWSGRFRNREIFVKYGGKPEIVRNEINMQAFAHSCIPQYVPEVLIGAPEYLCIGTEYVNAFNLEELMHFGIDAGTKERIIRELPRIQAQLSSHGILHRDIRPANILVGRNQIFLIDFQFAVRMNADGSYEELEYLKEHPEVAATLGEQYAPAAGDWNDAYSVSKVIAELEACACFDTCKHN